MISVGFIFIIIVPSGKQFDDYSKTKIIIPFLTIFGLPKVLIIDFVIYVKGKTFRKVLALYNS